jgi:choline dehydrogenase
VRFSPFPFFTSSLLLPLSSNTLWYSQWTRSYAKDGYLDPIDYRSNLVVLTGYQATKIVFDGTTATGIEFAASDGNTTYTVSANEEVILSTGVIGTPRSFSSFSPHRFFFLSFPRLSSFFVVLSYLTILFSCDDTDAPLPAELLQVSGVGPSDVLTGLGITVVKDLPGVGMHLTDHLSGAITLNTSFPFSGDPMETNTTYAAEQLALWKEGDASSLYTSPNDAVAYVNLTVRLRHPPTLDML